MQFSLYLSVSNNILEQLLQFFYDCIQKSVCSDINIYNYLPKGAAVVEWRNAYVISLRLLTYPMHNQYFCHEKISTILFYYPSEFCTNTLLARLAHNASLVIQSPTCFPFQYKY